MGTSTAAATAAKPKTITVTYKSDTKTLAYHASERVRALIEDAIVRFDIDHGEKRLALFDASSRELDEQDKLRDAGVEPADHLTLRVKNVKIIYNGEEKNFDYHGHQSVDSLRQSALAAFGVTTNVHLMSLFDEENHELTDTSTLRDSHVKPGDTLVLRQSTVKGG
jgi:hypothetical protein